MDLAFTQAELDFRQEVREFLATSLPHDLSEKVRLNKHLGKDVYQRWHAILNDKGWLAPSWPLEHGGAGWSPVQKHIFEEEACLAHAPRGRVVAPLPNHEFDAPVRAQRVAFVPRSVAVQRRVPAE